MVKKIRVYLVLGFIVLLAFILRVNQVTSIPPSLNWDEVSIGYNAYSILKTGQDEWGQFVPLNFKSYGEYKLPVQIYASIPGIAIFGLNDFGVRITPVVYGTLTVFAAYFLALAFFGSIPIALLTSFLLSISPWHIQLTRGSFEASFACFWVVLGLNFLIRGFQKQKYWLLAAIFFAVAVYTYNSVRGFIPFFALVVLVLYWRNLLAHYRIALLAAMIFIGLLLPLVPFITNGDIKARYKLVSITDDPGLIPRINEQRGLSTLPQPFPRLVHNKVTYLGFYFAQNYIAHFSPEFLFISGAPHKQHHVQGIGQLYLFEAPFLLLGLLVLFSKWGLGLESKPLNNFRRYRWLLLGWVLVTYIPVALTNDSIPHALRTVIVLPSYQLISAVGFYAIWFWIKKNRPILIWPFLTVVIAALLACVIYYLNLYYKTYPVNYSKDWQYGYHSVVNYVKDHQQNYDLVVVTRAYGEPHMFTLFYTQYDPYKFVHDPKLIRFETYNWIRVLNFDRYYFPDLGDVGTQYQDIIKVNPGKKILFVGKPGDFPDNAHKLEQINFLDGQPAWQIVDNQ